MPLCDVIRAIQVAEKRVLFDKQGRKWIRMDDGGYLDKDGYIWLVGRVAWKVQRNDKSFWSIVVEEKVGQLLGACVIENKQY